MSDVTRILEAIGEGDPSAASQLLPLVYDELRRLAAQKLALEPAGMTLQPTALVHEAYLRLVGPDGTGKPWDSRGHFFAAAAEAMRRILVENARRRKSQKRGGGLKRQDPEEAALAAPEDSDDILALDEALEKLAQRDPVKVRLVHLRYFAGMTIEEAASMLGISPATAKRSWTYTRAWLFQHITDTSPAPPRVP